MSSPKNGEKIPALVAFGRIRRFNLNQTAAFLKKDADAAKKAARDAANVPIHLVLQMCDRDPIQIGRR